MAEYDKIALADAVKARISSLGITQRGAAELSGVPLSAINRARNYQPVGAANYVLLCDWVAVDPGDLIIKENVSHETASETTEA